MDYAVDFRLLRRPLQLSTRTMKRVEAPGFLEDPKNRRFASSVYYGGRYFICAKAARRVCNETDERWFREIYKRKGF